MKAKARPNKQFCLRGHDTHVVGRYTDGRCKQCKAEQKAREDILNRVAPEYVPDLLPLRRSRGHTAEELAWASRLEEEDYLSIETLKRKATHEERVAIFQALNFLAYCERELLEKELEMSSKMRMSGLAQAKPA